MDLIHGQEDEVNLIHGPEEKDVNLVTARTRSAYSTNLKKR